MRAARTDKGVSAVGQVVSFKMRGVDRPGMLADVQSHLPAQIKLFGFVRVTNSFDARWGLQDGVLWTSCLWDMAVRSGLASEVPAAGTPCGLHGVQLNLCCADAAHLGMPGAGPAVGCLACT